MLSGLDSALAAQAKVSHSLSDIEAHLVPDGYTRIIPEEYSSLPTLQGRAEVDMVIRRPDNSQYDVDGKLYDKLTLHMVIDGYNAPITGGNIVDLVQRGFYNGKKVRVPHSRCTNYDVVREKPFLLALLILEADYPVRRLCGAGR